MKVSAILRKTKICLEGRDAKVMIRLFVTKGEMYRVTTPLYVIAKYWDDSVPGYKLETPIDIITLEEQDAVNIYIRKVLKMVKTRYRKGCDAEWLASLLSQYATESGDELSKSVLAGHNLDASGRVQQSSTSTSSTDVQLSQTIETQEEKPSCTPNEQNSCTSEESCTLDTDENCTSMNKSCTPNTEENEVSSFYRPKGYSKDHKNKTESELAYEAMTIATEEDDALLVTECFERYLKENEFNGWHHQALSSVMHRLQRYEKWLGFTSGNKDYRLYMEDFDKEQVEDFADYMFHESEYRDREPKFFEQFHLRNPKWIRPMSRNSSICGIKRLNMFLNWAVRSNLLHDTSFRQMTCDQQIYGTPYYLTLEERDRIATLDLRRTPRLEFHREKFIFQCHVGCRVGDLNLFTWDHINGNYLEYIPHKNLLKGRTTMLRVPLTEQAKEILMGIDPDAHYLFRNYEDEIYRQDIKEILKRAGIDREVMVYNSQKECTESKVLYEVAASHLARRTFIGNLYKEVKDPALIACLTGHTETSTSFNRYRTIDDDVKRDVLKFIE